MRSVPLKSSSRGSAGLLQLFRALRIVLGERFPRFFPLAGLGSILGQRQWFDIARVFSEAQILVMDEPTNALDQRSEELFKTTLEELRGRRTLILVAHRPSTLEVCERILLVDRGDISPAPREAVERFWQAEVPAG